MKDMRYTENLWWLLVLSQNDVYIGLAIRQTRNSTCNKFSTKVSGFQTGQSSKINLLTQRKGMWSHEPLLICGYSYTKDPYLLH